MAKADAKEGNGRKHTPRQALPEDQEARLAAVSEAYPERKDALAYGRKLLKVQAGLRNTPAPLTTLSKEEGARVREILGIPEPERKAKETAAA